MIIPKITALVPMKGHSERVPHKNIRQLVDRPACHWVLGKLNECKYIDEIIVDTDDEEIAEVAKPFEKVKVIPRPDFLLGDMVGIQPLIEFDMAHSRNNFFLQTHSTNPCVKPETYEKAIEAFFSQKTHDALFSVTEIKSRFYWPDGRGINHDPKHLIRTQDLEPIYEENSCFYLFSRETNEKVKNRLGDNPMMYPIDALEAADIDYMDDFYWCEFLLSKDKK